MNVKAQAIVNLAPKEAIEMYLDPEIALEVNVGYQKYEVVEGTYNKEGSIIRYYLMQAGKLIIIEQKVTEIIEGKKVVTESFSKGFNATMTTTFEEVDGKTKMEVNAEYKYTFIIRLISPFFKKSIEKETQDRLDTIKTIMENKAKSLDNDKSVDEIEDKKGEVLETKK